MGTVGYLVSYVSHILYPSVSLVSILSLSSNYSQSPIAVVVCRGTLVLNLPLHSRYLSLLTSCRFLIEYRFELIHRCRLNLSHYKGAFL